MTASSPSASTVCLEIVDQQIAGRDTESVLVQPLYDRRALAARGTGHQRDAIGAH